MGTRQPLESGQQVKYREAARVYAAQVSGDMEDDIYCLNIIRPGNATTTMPVHRHDIYADDDLAYLIDDLLGVSEDALAEVHGLLSSQECCHRNHKAHGSKAGR